MLDDGRVGIACRFGFGFERACDNCVDWYQAEWVYRHDDNEIVNLVRNGTYSAGLVLRPATVATTRAAAVAGVRMPQKTTFFYPKPRTGMVFRSLDT